MGRRDAAERPLEDARSPASRTPVPIVWGNRVFVVTAVSSAGDKTFRTGLYGDVAPVEDLSEHTWKIYCLDKATGKILWERDAFKGVPKVKRHTKSSQANSTPVTDGTRVVAHVRLDRHARGLGHGRQAALEDRHRRARQRLVLRSRLPVGTLELADHSRRQGHRPGRSCRRTRSSPPIDVETGKQLWRTDRDEISSWGTPTVFRAGNREQIVTNGPKMRGYDPATGKLLWTLGPNSEVTVGTPVVGDGVVYVTGGYPPARPIYAVKPNASGDISMPKDKTSNEVDRLEQRRRHLHPDAASSTTASSTRAATTASSPPTTAKTGERIYRARVGGGGSFSASPIAADGRLYFANEDGDVYRRARRPHVRGAREEPDEGSDHVHAGDLGRSHDRANARTRLRDRSEVAQWVK